MANNGKLSAARYPKQRSRNKTNRATTNQKSKGSTLIALLKSITILTFLLLLAARMLVSCIKLN